VVTSRTPTTTLRVELLKLYADSCMNNHLFSNNSPKFITLREPHPRRLVAAVFFALLTVLVTLSSCSSHNVQFRVDTATPSPGEQQAVAAEPGGSEAPPGAAQVAASIVGPGRVTANGKIAKISDGDTVTVQFADGAQEKVRFIGIDTPETKRPNTPIQCYGPEATVFTTALIPVGTEVLVERDVETRDRYGRLLGYIYRASDGLFVNEILAKYGYANLLTYPPNVAHVDTFRDAVTEARDANRGLWRACPATVAP
jgi:micrococcal nuclease